MKQGHILAGFAIILLLTLFSERAVSQIPNGSFENWATDPDTNFNPVGWGTTNSYPLVNVDRVSPGSQGSYAIRARTVSAGIINLPGIAILQTPFPFGNRPTQFNATFKSTLVGGDVALIIIGLMKGDSVVAATANCSYRIDTSFSQFTSRQFFIANQSNLVPDSMVIIIASGLAGGHVGTELIVDNISFSSSATGVSDVATVPLAFGLSQNFPNPFNPSTTIRYQVAAHGPVTLKIFDLLGRELTTLVNESNEAGAHTVTWNASGVASGVYIYRLQSGPFVEAKKLVVLK